MNAQMIEQQDALRYRLILIKTIGFFFCIGGVLLSPLLSDPIAQWVLAGIVGIGTITVCYSSIRSSIWLRKVNQQPELKNALYNEMFMSYEYKSLGWGFSAFVIAALLIGCTSTFLHISAHTACFGVLFCGVMVSRIAQLVYHS